MGLICFDCHIYRNDLISEVRNDHGMVVGYRCKKCTHKMYVKNIPSTVANGWRVRFNNLIEKIRKSNEKPLFDKQENAADSIPTSDIENDKEIIDNLKKKTVVQHVKEWFKK